MVVPGADRNAWPLRGGRSKWVGRCLLAATGLLVQPPLLAAGAPSVANASAAADAREVSASIGQGVVWVWPDSNGPLAGSRRAAPPAEAAVMVEALVIRAKGLERRPRRQAVVLQAGVRAWPVLHIESADDAPDLLSDRQQADVVALAQRLAESTTGRSWFQLDFEAPPRQRASFIRLVAALRLALPVRVRVSVTALAHWCTQGDWLDRLAADEVVPMLYRLGPHAASWRERFVNPEQSGLALRCRGPAMGFSVQDPPPAALLARITRPYWFDQAAWSNPSQPPRAYP